MKTNYEVLRDSYLEKAGNRKLYEIELAKPALVETIDSLSKVQSTSEREAFFQALDHGILNIKNTCQAIWT